MSDIISTPPAPASPANSKVETPAFWPDIDANQLRDQINLQGEIPHARLKEAITWGAMTVLSELADWQAGKMAEGFAVLTAVTPVVLVDGKTRFELLFMAAVSAIAAARLCDRNPDLTAGREGSDRGEQRRSLADEFLADATRAIRDIRGENRTTSELI